MEDTKTRRVALVVALLSSFINPFLGASMNIALPALARDLGLNAVALGWVQSAYLVAAAAVLVPAGRYADVHGRKRVFVLGATLFACAVVLAGLAWGPTPFFVARVLQGLGSALMVANTVAILVSVFPPSARGRVIGLNVAAVYVGLSLGPTLGGLITQHLSWRWLFFGAAPLAGVMALAAHRCLSGEWADAQGEPVHRWDALLYASAVAATMTGITLLPGDVGVGLALAGGLGLAMFGILSRRRRHPLYPVRALTRNRLFALSNLTALLTYVSSYGIPFLLSLYLQHVGGLDASNAGLVLLAQPAVMAITVAVAGRLADRLEPRLLVTIGLLLHATGLIALAQLEGAVPLWTVVGVLGLVGCGLGLFSSPNVTAIVGAVDKSTYGVASASAGTMRLLGQSLSMAVVALVSARIIGPVKITPERYGALVDASHLCFQVFAAVALIAAVASVLRGRLHAAT